MCAYAVAMADTWWDYVQRVSGGASQNEIARKIDVAVSSVGRWHLGSDPSPQSVRAFAIGYGRPVTEAFIAAGHLQPEDVSEDGAAPVAERRFEDDAEQEIWDAAPGALTDDERWALIAHLRSYRSLREQSG